MRIKYNAPVTLTFTFISVIILLLDTLFFHSLTTNWFSTPIGFDFTRAQDYLRLFTHILGHANWTHFLGNFSFILLLGPILEETYGSINLLIMILLTALATAILNIIFFKTGLLGASGIVFMMILLISFTNFNAGEIPLTFIFILILYLGKEVISSFQNNNISEFAHIIGGGFGCLFGFLRPIGRKV